jgi:preprotein translocase subunit SecE
VADRKRRGEDAVDERLDEAIEDDAPTDEDALAEDDVLDEELLDEDLADEDEDAAEEPARARGRTRSATKPKAAAGAKKTGPPRKSGKTRDADRPNVFGRIINFVREVVAELRKVIWPTRKELLTYTAVVIVFVTIVLSLVAGLDAGFARAVLWVFGNGKGK